MREGGHINALFVGARPRKSSWRVELVNGSGRCICIVAFDLEKGKECLALHELLA